MLPANVRHHKELSASAKLLYAECSAMLNETGIAAVPNEALREWFTCDDRTISRWFKELREFKLVYTAIENTAIGAIRVVSFDELKIAACRDLLPPDIFVGCTSINNKGKSGDLPSCSSGKNDLKTPPDILPGLESPAPKPAAKSDALDYNAILASYHALCPAFPKIRTLSEQRKGWIRSRFKEAGGKASVFAELFTRAQASKFLRGETGGKWSADFDFLMSPKGFTKTLEGRYDDTDIPARATKSETPDLT